MAGVLGGCQSLHTDSMDETLGLPTETAVRVALRTQQILAHETGVHRTVDQRCGERPFHGQEFVAFEAPLSLQFQLVSPAFHPLSRCASFGNHQEHLPLLGMRREQCCLGVVVLLMSTPQFEREYA